LIIIGKWLIWYATQIGLRYCSGGVSDTLILLKSLDSAFDYYIESIGAAIAAQLGTVGISLQVVSQFVEYIKDIMGC
jgi:hypothetical protein